MNYHDRFDHIKAAFSSRLKSLREERGISRQQLADGTGIALASIGHYERGGRVPDMRVLWIFSDFFGVSSDYLLGTTNKATVAEEWPSAVPSGVAPDVQKLKEVAEGMISDGHHANKSYGYSAFRKYVEIFEGLRAIDEVVADKTQKMALKYPGFTSFGRLDAIEIEGIGFREALIQGKPEALEYVAAYNEALNEIQEQIREVAANVSDVIESQIIEVVTCGAIVGFPAPSPPELNNEAEGEKKEPRR